MKTVTLNNGVEMPIIGLGSYKATSPVEAKEAIIYALQCGYRMIDTASYYRNEELVGKAVRESGIPREEIFVTSKVWVDAIDAGKVRESFEASLKRLDIGYIDLFLLHWPVSKEANIKGWRALEEVYREGKVRAIGLSNYMQKHIDDLLEEAEIMPALDQVELHPDFTQYEIQEFCKEKGIQLGAWSPLGGQKPNSGSLFSDPTLLKLAEKYGRSVAQIIIRWDIQRGIVVIPKSIHKDRIKSNFEVFDFELSPEDMKVIDSLNCNNRIDQDPFEFMNYWNAKEEFNEPTI